MSSTPRITLHGGPADGTTTTAAAAGQGRILSTICISGSSETLQALGEEIREAASHGGAVVVRHAAHGPIIGTRREIVFDNEDMEHRPDLPADTLVAYIAPEEAEVTGVTPDIWATREVGDVLASILELWLSAGPPGRAGRTTAEEALDDWRSLSDG